MLFLKLIWFDPKVIRVFTVAERRKRQKAEGGKPKLVRVFFLFVCLSLIKLLLILLHYSVCDWPCVSGVEGAASTSGCNQIRLR